MSIGSVMLVKKLPDFDFDFEVSRLPFLLYGHSEKFAFHAL